MKVFKSVKKKIYKMVDYKSEVNCELTSYSKYTEFWHKYLKYLMAKLYIHLTKLK